MLYIIIAVVLPPSSSMFQLLPPPIFSNPTRLAVALRKSTLIFSPFAGESCLVGTDTEKEFIDFAIEGATGPIFSFIYPFI
ncbi:hypothetical protein VNO80_24963 [Phaseolus coccineus]|uniref:Uncharacterized protein n=1 Tax=Phaseolus coccineus TaxID=3886 RepID=A0AAN9LY87_PHACN